MKTLRDIGKKVFRKIAFDWTLSDENRRELLDLFSPLLYDERIDMPVFYDPGNGCYYEGWSEGRLIALDQEATVRGEPQPQWWLDEVHAERATQIREYLAAKQRPTPNPKHGPTARRSPSGL